jgi:hypothetical protein
MISHILNRLWRDEQGFVNTVDIVLMTTILGIGMLVGIVSLRNQIVQELTDVSMAVGFLDQSYSYEGNTSDTGLGTWVGTHEFSGSSYEDLPDFGEVADVSGSEPGAISVREAPVGTNTPGE